MREGEVIKRTETPATVESLTGDLRTLGIKPGTVLLVHSSLSAIGWVSGGVVAVIHALEAAVGKSGTLVMPTHSSDLSEPSNWEAPPVPEPWWETIRETMPAYDSALTPTRGMGKIPECFRKQKGVLRSSHPHTSFSACGPSARSVVNSHELAFELGESSPLARIYDLDGRILLLGVGHGNNTSLHLSEYRASFPGKKVIRAGAPMMVDGVRRWETFEDFETEDLLVLGFSDTFTRKGLLLIVGVKYGTKRGLLRQR